MVLVLLLEESGLPTHLAEARLGHAQQRPGALWGEIERDQQRVARLGRHTSWLGPTEREHVWRPSVHDGQGHDGAAGIAVAEDDRASRAGGGLEVRRIRPPLPQ